MSAVGCGNIRTVAFALAAPLATPLAAPLTSGRIYREFLLLPLEQGEEGEEIQFFQSLDHLMLEYQHDGLLILTDTLVFEDNRIETDY